MFVSRLNGHPELVELHKRMKPLFAGIKADADIEDEMKEGCDGYHSEQLAVACALSKSHEAAPIFIVKAQGKMCDECHSLMKLISKARKRLIRVRDNTGFHHFEDGSCSCSDYW